MMTSSLSNRITFAVCGGLLGVFAALSWSAVQTKNATIDEPLHLMSGWVALRHNDFRLVPESPPLWQFWAALPNLDVNLNTRFEGKVWNDVSFDSQDGINWAAHTLYETPGNNGESVIRRSRFMMLLLGVALGAVIAWWANRLAGGIAAITAVGFYCFDPNLLAHAPIVKSDVPLALVTLALTGAVWQMGRQASLLNCIIPGVLCGIGINTKFSGLILFLILVVLLLIRAILPLPWPAFGRSIQTRWGRLLLAAATCATAAVLCIAITWAAYGFRFRPAPSLNSRMDMTFIRQRAILLETAASSARDPTAAEIANWKPSLIVRAVDFANDHRLLPQAMLGGLLYQHACLQLWPGYLMGRLYGVGPWYYFPLAILFKTPLATLVAVGASVVILLIRFKPVGRSSPDKQSLLWSFACIAVPFGIFAVAAMQSNINIGVRSVLPLYPFLFIMIGTMTSRAIKLWRRTTLVVMTVLAIALMTETLRAWPDYIPFFNTAAGGGQGGFALLGDSNIDWGQDLKPLAVWQQEHPGVRVYLHYFGAVNPRYFGFHNQFNVSPDGSRLESNTEMQPGFIAISTNYLQGLHDEPHDVTFFRRLGQRPPDEIVGGSIYLYRYPLR